MMAALGFHADAKGLRAIVMVATRGSAVRSWSAEGWSSWLKAAKWATACSWERGDSGVGKSATVAPAGGEGAAGGISSNKIKHV